MIRKATMDDLIKIDQLALQTIRDMKTSNIPQWEYSYPRLEHYQKDVLNDGLYVVIRDHEVVGVMALFEENDPPYKEISSWKKEYSIVLHRILVDPSKRNSGIAQELLDFAINYCKEYNYESIKIDTHLKNYKMRSFLEKNNFIQGDYIESIDRIAYEYVVEDNL